MLRTCRGPVQSTDVNVRHGSVKTCEAGESGWSKEYFVSAPFMCCTVCTCSNNFSNNIFM